MAPMNQQPQPYIGDVSRVTMPQPLAGARPSWKLAQYYSASVSWQDNNGVILPRRIYCSRPLYLLSEAVILCFTDVSYWAAMPTDDGALRFVFFPTVCPYVHLPCPEMLSQYQRPRKLQLRWNDCVGARSRQCACNFKVERSDAK